MCLVDTCKAAVSRHRTRAEIFSRENLKFYDARYKKLYCFQLTESNKHLRQNFLNTDYTPKLDIEGTVYNHVIYMQSNKIRKVFLMIEFYSSHMLA